MSTISDALLDVMDDLADTTSNLRVSGHEKLDSIQQKVCNVEKHLIDLKGILKETERFQRIRFALEHNQDETHSFRYSDKNQLTSSQHLVNSVLWSFMEDKGVYLPERAYYEVDMFSNLGPCEPTREAFRAKLLAQLKRLLGGKKPLLSRDETERWTIHYNVDERLSTNRSEE